MKRDLISASIIALILFGGMQFFLHSAVLQTGVIIGFGLMVWAGWLIMRGASIPYGSILIWPAAAVVLSVYANWQIYPATMGRVYFYLAAGSVLVICHHSLTERQIFAGIRRAGWVWGLLWPVFYGLGFLWPVWLGNHNIWVCWAVLFVAVGMYQSNRLYIVPHLVALLFFASRGAITATAVVFVVSAWPVLRQSRYILASSAPFLAVGGVWLFLWRPATALVRLHYWHSAWAAFMASPIFGVGPGGLKVGQWIADGADYQIHAHNSLISWAAETGIIGLLALAAALYVIRNTQYALRPWQLAAIAGLTAHSLVDEPLWWPGPLLAAAIIISTPPAKIS